MCALEYEKIHEIRSMLRGTTLPGGARTHPEMEHLTAIFSQAHSQHLLLVYNIDSLSELPLMPNGQELPLEACLLRDLPERDLVAYDGPVIAFNALDLIRNDILTKGTRFYPIENFYLEAGERVRLLRSMHRLAGVLVDYLTRWPVQRAEQLRYRIEAKAIQLALPYLLANWDCERLVGVIPSKDLASLITTGECQLIYTVPDAAPPPPQGISLARLVELGKNTQRDWIVGMDEIGLFDPEIQPEAPYFLELRHLLLLAGKEQALQTTLHTLAHQCYELRAISETHERHAWMLMAESWLADIELDDLVVYSPVDDFQAYASCGEAACVYRVIYGSTQTAAIPPMHLISLDTLRKEGLPEGYRRFPLTLIDLPRRPEQSTDRSENHYQTGNLGAILWKMGKEQILARSLWLTADDTLNEIPYPNTGLPAIPASYKTLSGLLDNTLRACMIYGLSDPWRWRQGRQALFINNLYITLERLLVQLENISPAPLPFYYRALRHWFNCYRVDLDTLHEHITQMSRELEGFRNHLEEVEQLAASELFGPLAEIEHWDMPPGRTPPVDLTLGRAEGIAEHLLQIKDLVLRRFWEVSSTPAAKSTVMDQIVLNLPKTMRDTAYHAELDLLSPFFYTAVASIASIQSEWPILVSRERDINALLSKANQLTHRLEAARRQTFALPHEMTILYSMCDRAIDFMRQAIKDIEQGAILQLSLLQDRVDFEHSPDLYLEIANIGRMEASDVEINLIHSTDYRLLDGTPIRTIPRLLPGAAHILTYAIQPGRDNFEITLQYRYNEKTGR